jgi:hypothetical protein
MLGRKNATNFKSILQQPKHLITSSCSSQNKGPLGVYKIYITEYKVLTSSPTYHISVPTSVHDRLLAHLPGSQQPIDRPRIIHQPSRYIRVF